MVGRAFFAGPLLACMCAGLWRTLVMASMGKWAWSSKFSSHTTMTAQSWSSQCCKVLLSRGVSAAASPEATPILERAVRLLLLQVLSRSIVPAPAVSIDNKPFVLEKESTWSGSTLESADSWLCMLADEPLPCRPSVGETKATSVIMVAW